MLKPLLKSLLLVGAMSAATPLLAADDATLSQVYQAAHSGHVDQAQQMMAQVLRDHPNSAKAHYVEAELDARQGQYGAARGELSTAERLEPGLPFASAQSVSELRAQLSQSTGGSGSRTVEVVQQNHSSHWGGILILLAIGAVIWMVIRGRRPVGPQYIQNSMGSGGTMGGYGPYSAPPAGGMGSGIVGGLASGLAVGAGVVAGEELMHHILDGDRHPDSVRYIDDTSAPVNPNADMGGNDFGVSDNGSWDDGGSVGGDFGGGGGGGDDWS